MNSLNEEQYTEICKACDHILLAPDASIERIAITWLHVIREHPIFLSRYIDLFYSVSLIKRVSRYGTRVLLGWAWWTRQLWRIMRANGQFWYGPKDLPVKVDFLFISHALNSKSIKTDDFYYCNLPNDLVSQGYTVMIGLINQSGQSSKVLANKVENCPFQRVIFSDTLSFWGEVSLYCRLKKESSHLRLIGGKKISCLLRKAISRASQEALTGNSQTTLRISEQIGELVSQTNAKSIILLHEGHAWERVAFASARAAIPSINCFGYQQAIIFRLQHAIRRKLARKYNPDHIFTSGEFGAEQLRNVPELERIPVSVLGSDRGFIKGASVHKSVDKQRFNFKTCLVIPEGIPSECRILFEFSLACAEAFPDILFVWRLHPLFTFESLGFSGKMKKNIPENITLSQETLDIDIARCRWALYRGTSAIIKAVGAGVRPLYLSIPEELSIDPLYEMKNWHTLITDIDDFRDVISAKLEFPYENENSEEVYAKQYCLKFFSPFNLEALTNAVELQRNFIV